MKESAIQRCILDGLAAKRVWAFRLNSGGTKITGGYFRAHTLGKGAADILAFPSGGVCWIEVKNEHGKPSPEQDSFAEKARNEGHDYLLARSWEDVEAYLKGWDL